nr:unknown [uncultured archaeon]AAU82370.1 hypothetical protein GZ17A3_32 [uncultured archaeon GZfos17A3]
MILPPCSLLAIHSVCVQACTLNFFSISASRTSNPAIFSITGSFASSESNLKSMASNLEIISFLKLSTLPSADSNLTSTDSNFDSISFLRLSMRTSTLLSTLSIFASRAFISPLISFSFGRSIRSIQPGIFSMMNKCLPHAYIKYSFLLF